MAQMETRHLSRKEQRLQARVTPNQKQLIKRSGLARNIGD
jgi:uncharacterized protein (DUF1778 family)